MNEYSPGQVLLQALFKDAIEKHCGVEVRREIDRTLRDKVIELIGAILADEDRRPMAGDRLDAAADLARAFNTSVF